MANKKLNKYIGTVILGTAILAVPGCSDTWDDHYEVGDSGNVATKTLWEQITSNPDLSRFAEIAKRTKFYRDEKHPQSTYTYADILNGGQVNTVWLPRTVPSVTRTMRSISRWLRMMVSTCSSSSWATTSLCGDVSMLVQTLIP